MEKALQTIPGVNNNIRRVSARIKANNPLPRRASGIRRKSNPKHTQRRSMAGISFAM